VCVLRQFNSAVQRSWSAWLHATATMGPPGYSSRLEIECGMHGGAAAAFLNVDFW
jgi:hypothetical protein